MFAVCAKCDTGEHLKDHRHLQQHFYRHHQQGEFECSIEQCGAVASTRQAALNHFNTTHGEFRCTFVGCHKAFGTIGKLKNHKIVHLNLHPYRCKWPGCEKTCKVESNLIVHIRGVHF